MAEDRRGQRPARGGASAGRGGSSSRSSDARGGSGRSSSSSGDSRGRSSSRGDAPRGGSKDGAKGGSSRGGYQGKSDSRSQDRAFRGRAEPKVRTADQAEYDGPELPEDVTGAELDRGVRAQLKGLPEKLAARVARHLAAAGVLIDEDPELAYRHTLAARARASRLAVVREATGEAAYAAGHYDVALAELRAAKRMNGATDYLPIMADCHRALGNPEQAIKLAKSPSVANFSTEAKAEMTLVEAGARRDMGQLDAALRTLELAPLTSKSRSAWAVRLRYAYADTLESAGREADALAWFHRTHAIDSDEITDAAERADQLERRQS
ncbi:tetratricopeptide repeat protein [Nocardioides glacieisoli]|uniref:Tetratricopeptide repeat protein n=1 Tax=Nocardioides glacieisoli TaxID=1168730 RepID=A0A4Q2RIK7_9ACTN|nr:tetratricopeptide repeat protein [Nocardioides glacieisoli]RYB88367.1 tetratricopeptide repeat protein [Nocardioides glacieisoli]